MAIAAFAVSASTAALAERTGEAAFTLVAALVLAAQAAPLVVRRRYPVVSAATVGVFSMIYGLVDWADPLIPITAVVSLAAVFEYCERRTALIVLGVAGVAAVVATGLAGDSDALDWGVVVLTLVLSPVIGELMRGRRRHILELEARNEQLETERQRAVEEARIAERQRIARELHDVVTHNVTMLVVRAEAAASTPRCRRWSVSRRSTRWPTAAGARSVSCASCSACSAIRRNGSRRAGCRDRAASARWSTAPARRGSPSTTGAGSRHRSRARSTSPLTAWCRRG